MIKSMMALALFSALTAVPVSAQTSGARSAPANDAAAGRIERVEEQLADLQGVVAAVETLAKTNSGGSSGYAASGGGAGNEQVRQLSDQIAELTQRIERLEARLGGSAPGAGAPARGQSEYNATVPPGGFEDKEQLPSLQGQAAPQDRPSYASRPQSPVQPYSGSSPDVRPAPQSRAQPTVPAAGSSAAAVRPATSAGAPTPGSPAPSTGSRALFDQGVSALNRREYQAAESYFNQFLQDYPSDPQAGVAQFWLGDTAYVTGDYRTAADRFLSAFKNYPSSAKAPEALLKLAISLRRLGENEEACSSFAELARRYPQAPAAITQLADKEKQRARCS